MYSSTVSPAGRIPPPHLFYFFEGTQNWGWGVYSEKSIFARIFSLASPARPTTRPGLPGMSCRPQAVEGLDRRLPRNGFETIMGPGGRGGGWGGGGWCVLSLLRAKIHDAYLIPVADPITH